MGKSSATKEIMGMRTSKTPIKSKDGFPNVPKEQKSMDDLGYFTKAKRLRGK